MERDRIDKAQWILIAIAVALVVSFFAFGMVGGRPQDQPVPTPSQEQPAPSVDEEGPQPGVPLVPVEEHETWPDREPRNPDRQLDYEAPDPEVLLDEAPSEDLTGYWSQSVAWEACGEHECATVQVPLDWEDPSRAAIDIAMRRVPSTDGSRGPLFVNPGGPGFGGQDFAAGLGADYWQGYDLVGWDPRGTGQSTTVECGETRETDAVYGLDGSPDDAGEEEALLDGWTTFAQDCRDASGALLDHLTTIENVRDLDLLRHLLGAEALNYFGVSYGTYVGAVYAELFPDRVGRMVLDAAVDITDDEETVSQAEGFERALRAYAEWCAAEDRCTFGDDAEAVLAEIAEFLAGLDESPISVGDRELTQSLATTGVAFFLYADEEAYPGLTFVLGDAMEGRAGDLLSAADQLNGRGPASYETVAFAFPATRCADWADEGVRSAYQEWGRMVSKSPIFATNMGIDLVCERWTADSAPYLKLTAEGAPPILVVGTTGDSATPYEHAVSMAEQLESGILLTYDGAGHGAVTGGNECVSDVVGSYLVDGDVPDDQTTCT